MAITIDQFRSTLRMFPAGVTLVTTKTPDGERCGMTVSSFASVSADPPLISVAVDRQTTMSKWLLVKTNIFAVSVLAQDQEALSSRFAFVKDEDRFAVGNWSEAVTGAPILKDALTWLDCRIHFRQQAGSHNIFIGQVMASEVVRPDDRPLLYWNRDYRRLEKPAPAPPSPETRASSGTPEPSEAKGSSEPDDA